MLFARVRRLSNAIAHVFALLHFRVLGFRSQLRCDMSSVAVFDQRDVPVYSEETLMGLPALPFGDDGLAVLLRLWDGGSEAIRSW